LRLDHFGNGGKRIYIGLKSTRAELFKINKWITAVNDELMDLRLQSWHGKGFKEWGEWNPYNAFQAWSNSPIKRIINVDSIRTRKLFQADNESYHDYDPDFESRDSSFFDITLLQDRRDSPRDLYNRKKSVYIGIQNRRTDPLIYRDSNFIQLGQGSPPPPISRDFRGEIMFFSSAEMDSNVRFGGKDLWGLMQNGEWWQTQWWRRFGVRELKMPITIPVYGNGTYLIAEELGLEKLDTLGWWYADSLYHKIDTVLSNGDDLLAKLLPGQGKIIKMSYVPYFFSDPTKDTIPNNDSCYFCDIFNDFDLFEFDVVAKTDEEEGCCYDISFTYNGDCTFFDIPFRLLFEGTSGNTFTDSDTLSVLSDSSGTNIKFKNIVMDLDSNTGTVSLGTYCISDVSNKYKISILAGKDKADKFIGCDRELQFEVECGELEEVKDCCDDLVVTDNTYFVSDSSSPYCTEISIGTAFDSECIFGINLVDSNGYYKEVIAGGATPIDFTTGANNVFTYCYGRPACAELQGDVSGLRTVKMQFLGRDGTIVCEKEVELWLPCDYIGTDDFIFPGAKKSKPQEKKDSKTYKSETFDVTIWPNPTSGELNVEIDSKVETAVDIDILNNIGVGLSDENGISLNKGKNERHYNLDSYSSGVYYLQIKGKDGNIVLPIILNK